MYTSFGTDKIASWILYFFMYFLLMIHFTPKAYFILNDVI